MFLQYFYDESLAHASYVVGCQRSGEAGFVFVGSIGRPDLLETAAGVVGSAETGARLLYRSMRKFREPTTLKPAAETADRHPVATGDETMSTLTTHTTWTTA